MSLQNVKAFYKRLATDEALRTQLQAVGSKDECSQIVRNAGYDFTSQEFEEYTAQLLESNSDNGEITDLDGVTDLNEKELDAVFGGASSIVGKPIIRPLYGVVEYPWPRPQPMYGIVVRDDLPKLDKREDNRKPSRKADLF
ncbi:MAG: Nif11-like leader peptide family natural product precursor [Rivularia sp. (in: Bacteria)]|nr:Nif11-like leader peptide family natural product precursor [Rivularia sp. MS3]